MQYPTQLLYDLRDTTAWISGESLQELFKVLVSETSPSGFKSNFNYRKLAALDDTVIRLLESKQFSVVRVNHGKWVAVENNLSFLDCFELRKNIGRNDSFIVPVLASTILDKQSFNKEDIEFGDGFMSIKDVDFLMCGLIIVTTYFN